MFAPGILAAAAQAAQAGGPPSRRASFRIAPTDDMPQNDNSPSPDNGSPVQLMVEDDRRMRRRGSQLYAYLLQKKNFCFFYFFNLFFRIMTDLI